MERPGKSPRSGIVAASRGTGTRLRSARIRQRNRSANRRSGARRRVGFSGRSARTGPFSGRRAPFSVTGPGGLYLPERSGTSLAFPERRQAHPAILQSRRFASSVEIARLVRETDPRRIPLPNMSFGSVASLRAFPPHPFQQRLHTPDNFAAIKRHKGLIGTGVAELNSVRRVLDQFVESGSAVVAPP